MIEDEKEYKIDVMDNTIWFKTNRDSWLVTSRDFILLYKIEISNNFQDKSIMEIFDSNRNIIKRYFEGSFAIHKRLNELEAVRKRRCKIKRFLSNHN